MRLIISFILLFIVHINYAQTSKGTLTGKITDENGITIIEKFYENQEKYSFPSLVKHQQ